jgi:uncharacterized CHY-type Zn-finger protein
MYNKIVENTSNQIPYNEEILFVDSSSVVNTSFYESVKDISTCTICKGIVINPRQCKKCENIFCRECIYKWKENNSNCPFKCIKFSIVYPSKVAVKILRSLILRCPKNCSKEIKYENLRTHISQCQNKIIDCPTCGSKVSQDIISRQSFFELKIENDILKNRINELEEKIAQFAQSFNTNDNNNINKINYLDKKNTLGSEKPFHIKKKSQSITDIHCLDNFSILKEESIKNLTEKVSNMNFETHDSDVRLKYKFSCCNKYYECIDCHDKSESHQNSKVVSILCGECLVVTNNINDLFCENCGNSFDKERIIYENEISINNDLKNNIRRKNKNKNIIFWKGAEFYRKTDKNLSDLGNEDSKDEKAVDVRDEKLERKKVEDNFKVDGEIEKEVGLDGKVAEINDEHIERVIIIKNIINEVKLNQQNFNISDHKPKKQD